MRKTRLISRAWESGCKPFTSTVNAWKAMLSADPRDVQRRAHEEQPDAAQDHPDAARGARVMHVRSAGAATGRRARRTPVSLARPRCSGFHQSLRSPHVVATRFFGGDRALLTGLELVRLISAREATDGERKSYEEN